MLIVIDPTARRVDGESVRIARDVLCAGVRKAEVCLLDGPESMGSALARRGDRRLVVIGDDQTLLHAVRVLHQSGRLTDGGPLAIVPVGPGPTVALTRRLGVPVHVVAASRAVLKGASRCVDLMADDAGGVVLGTLGIPVPRPAWWRPGRGPSLVRTARLRVVADGRILADVDHPVGEVSVRAGDGLAEVVVRYRTGASEVSAKAASVTVSGPGFRYRADAVDRGPTRARTWTVLPGALRLTVPS